MAGGRVEAVAVATGDLGHARAEAADDDRRGRGGAQEARRITGPEPADQRDRVDQALTPFGVAAHGLSDRVLLRGVRRCAASARAESEQESPAAHLLQRRGHVREHTRRTIRDVQHERPEHDALRHLR